MDETTRSGGTPDEPDEDVPACDTGPAGRARFVRRELGSIWREWRGRRAPTGDRTGPTGSRPPLTTDEENDH